MIFWNVPELERNSVLKFLRSYAIEQYEEDLVYDESEMMNYTLSAAPSAHLEKGIIQLNPELDSTLLAKYTFSDAIACSVKLGAWEASLGE